MYTSHALDGLVEGSSIVQPARGMLVDGARYPLVVGVSQEGAFRRVLQDVAGILPRARSIGYGRYAETRDSPPFFVGEKDGLAVVSEFDPTEDPRLVDCSPDAGLRDLDAFVANPDDPIEYAADVARANGYTVVDGSGEIAALKPIEISDPEERSTLVKVLAVVPAIFSVGLAGMTLINCAGSSDANIYHPQRHLPVDDNSWAEYLLEDAAIAYTRGNMTTIRRDDDIRRFWGTTPEGLRYARWINVGSEGDSTEVPTQDWLVYETPCRTDCAAGTKTSMHLVRFFNNGGHEEITLEDSPEDGLIRNGTDTVLDDIQISRNNDGGGLFYSDLDVGNYNTSLFPRRGGTNGPIEDAPQKPIEILSRAFASR